MTSAHRHFSIRVLSPSAPQTLLMEEMETKTVTMRRAEHRAPEARGQLPAERSIPGAKMLRVSGRSAKPAKALPGERGVGGCPGSRPEAGCGRSSRGIQLSHVSCGDRNGEPHDRLAQHKDITPPLEPRPGGPAADAAPASKALLWVGT